MKKNILLSLFVLFSIQLLAQEKGSHLTISAGIGPTGYKYNMDKVNFADPKCEIKVGGQVGIGYSYYFTKHLGVSAGLNVSHYRTHGRLMGNFNYGNSMGDFNYDKYFVLGNYTDNDLSAGHVMNYELRVLTQDWIEYQSGKFVEIPLMFNAQKKFGEKESFGIYGAIGVKFQIPFETKYSIVDGAHEDQAKLNVYGYYEEKNLPLGHYAHPDLSSHGFGKIHNPSEVLTHASGKLDFKFNVALVAEAGFLVSLSRRVDVSLGAFIDYGVTNVNRNKEAGNMFTGPETDYISGAENYNVGKGISYNSITKSEYVNKVNTLSYGGKVGVRIKLGKLSKRPDPAPLKCDTTIINITEKQCNDSVAQQILNLLENMNRSTTNKRDTIIYRTDTIINSLQSYPQSDINKLFYPIYFDLNRSTLRPESIRDLNMKAEILKKYPEIRLLIAGNTCNLGTDTLNDRLGLDRAEVTKKYLIGRGIPADRLEIVTQSYFDPELPNTDEPNRMHNRRCDFKPIL